MVLGYVFKSKAGIIKVAILLYCHIQSTPDKSNPLLGVKEIEKCSSCGTGSSSNYREFEIKQITGNKEISKCVGIECKYHAHLTSRAARDIIWYIEKGIKQQSLINVQGWTLGHCPHVSIFIWKLNFFLTDTASVHTYPIKTINEDGTFRKRSPEWNFLKTLFYVNVWTDEKGLTVRKRRGHTISSNPLRVRLETYSRRRMGASLSCL